MSTDEEAKYKAHIRDLEYQMERLLKERAQLISCKDEVVKLQQKLETYREVISIVFGHHRGCACSCSGKVDTYEQ